MIGFIMNRDPEPASELKRGMWFQAHSNVNYNYKIRQVQDIFEVKPPVFRKAIEKGLYTEGNLLILCTNGDRVEYHPTSTVRIWHKA